MAYGLVRGWRSSLTQITILTNGGDWMRTWKALAALMIASGLALAVSPPASSADGVIAHARRATRRRPYDHG